MSDWRFPKERTELVERLINAERGRDVAEAKVRVLEDPLGPDHGLTVLALRCVELEATVAKLNATIVTLNDRLRRKAS